MIEFLERLRQEMVPLKLSSRKLLYDAIDVESGLCTHEASTLDSYRFKATFGVKMNVREGSTDEELERLAHLSFKKVRHQIFGEIIDKLISAQIEFQDETGKTNETIDEILSDLGS